MKGLITAKAKFEQSLLIHQIPARANFNGYRAIIIHPSTSLIGCTYGIDPVDANCVTVYIQSSKPYAAFVNFNECDRGYAVRCTLDDYLAFMSFIHYDWPEARQSFFNICNSSEMSEFNIGGQLFCFGYPEHVCKVKIGSHLEFAVWNCNVVVDDGGNTSNVDEFYARIKATSGQFEGASCVLDFNILEEICQDRIELEKIALVYKNIKHLPPPTS